VYRRFLSVRYLRTRFVNFLSVAGVMTGVAVLIVVTSVMDGMQMKVREVVRGTLSHVILVPMEEPALPYAEVDEALRKDPRIVATAPQVTAYVAYPYLQRPGREGSASKTAFHFMEAVGIDWDREVRVSRMAEYLKPGSEKADDPFYSQRARERGRKGALVSRRFVDTFFGETVRNEDVIGADIELLVPNQKTGPTGEDEWKFDTYRPVVSGVFDAEDQNADIGRILFDLEDLRQMARLEAEYMDVRVALADYGQASEVVRSVRRAFPDFGAQTWEDVRAHYLRAVNSEKVLLLVVLSFIVLLAGFTILATLMLTVVEKTRDIGVVKALGGTTGGILSIFLRSGALIGVLGGILGLGLGLLFTANVNRIHDLLTSLGAQIFNPDIYLFRQIPTHVDPLSVAAIVVGSAFLSFLAGLAPALRAARMDPVVALRYE
jgi:lipoprotein-releasing system permease protein